MAFQLRTLNNTFSAAAWPIQLVKGDTGFYFAAANNLSPERTQQVGKALASLPSSTIPRCNLNDQSLEAWIDDGRWVMRELAVLGVVKHGPKPHVSRSAPLRVVVDNTAMIRQAHA